MEDVVNMKLWELLPVTDLLNLCVTDTFYHNICQNNNNWKFLIQRDYNLSDLPPSINYRDYYFKLEEVKKLIHSYFKGKYLTELAFNLLFVFLIRLKQPITNPLLNNLFQSYQVIDIINVFIICSSYCFNKKLPLHPYLVTKFEQLINYPEKKYQLMHIAYSNNIPILSAEQLHILNFLLQSSLQQINAKLQTIRKTLTLSQLFYLLSLNDDNLFTNPVKFIQEHSPLKAIEPLFLQMYDNALTT